MRKKLSLSDDSSENNHNFSPLCVMCYPTMDFLKMLKKINRMFELVKTIQLMYVIKYQYNTDPHSTFARSLYKLALN